MRIGFELYEGLLDRFLDLLKETLDQTLVSLVLYGSVARSEARCNSDVDLLLVLGDPPTNYLRRLDIILEVRSRLMKEGEYERVTKRLGFEPYLSFMILSKQEAMENRYIYLDMVDESRILYDRDNFFAERLREIRNRLSELGSKKIWLDDGTWYWDLKPDLKPGEVFTL